jgi:hypothetical protein
MTPTIWGRWQTRIAMFLTIGVIVTAFFALFDDTDAYFRILFYVGVFGLVWDIIYIFIQQVRWDRDWPPVFQWAAGFVEGAFVWILLEYFGLPGIADGEAGVVPFDRFLSHYLCVFFAIWLWLQGPMRVVFPFWRFHGGRII